jgi:hypothetical protein
MTNTATQTAVAAAYAAIQAAKAGYLNHIEKDRAAVADDMASHKDIRGDVSRRDGDTIRARQANRLRAYADNDAVAHMDAAISQVRARRDQAANIYNTIRRELSPDGDTASELRAGRYWSRTKDLLDSLKKNGGPDTHGIMVKAQELIAKAEPTELGVLLEEIETYCVARGVPTQWIDPAINQKVPDYAQAKRTLTNANKALTVLEQSAGSIHRAVASGQPAPMIISDPTAYDPDQ